MDVTDTGIGIAADYVDKIFESFTQAGSDTARKFGGTGLGLTISRQLTELMGGEISVKSELGKGTTFTVVIPFTECNVVEECAKQKTVDEASLKMLDTIKLLLVEDNEFNQMVAEDTLKEILPNIKIDISVNGEEAVARVKSGQYDIVLMDIQMPVMDGLEATKAIRTTLAAPAKDIKIIAMTANVLQEDVKHYFEIGMDAYVSKPFQTEELLLKMAGVLADRMKTVGAQPTTSVKPEAMTQPKKEELPPLPEVITDMNFLRQFASGNEDKMRKYKNMFLDNAPKLLSNIDKAMADKDFTAIKIAAHSLKPQLSYMGVKEEVSHIFLIEQTASEAGHYDRLQPLIDNLNRVCEKAFGELR
jgi:CheY-like chemotaxis protein/HPt (histidine-containing phosphotransfer) domain-containing protein